MGTNQILAVGGVTATVAVTAVTSKVVGSVGCCSSRAGETKVKVFRGSTQVKILCTTWQQVVMGLGDRVV